jgi:TPR repeat protein
LRPTQITQSAKASSPSQPPKSKLPPNNIALKKRQSTVTNKSKQSEKATKARNEDIGSNIEYFSDDDIKWFGRRAEQAYESGYYAKAVWYGELGIKYNNAQAITVLGKCYLYGYGISKYEKRAFNLFQAAAQQNYWNSQYWLGWCYHNGYGVTQDYASACQWYAKAIENPNTTKEWLELAKKNYQKCNNGVPYNVINNSSNSTIYGDRAYIAYLAKVYEDAIKYGELGANGNDARAMTVLGDCYLYGHGVSKNQEKAVSYYQEAAKQNFYIAQGMLGYCYQYGFGVTENLSIACQWYAKIIENQNADTDWIKWSKDCYKECNNGVAYKAGGE